MNVANNSVYEVSHRGIKLKMYVEDPIDVIQKCHVSGKFYEIEELECLRSIIPPKSSVLDIGANVGNHSLYFAAICRCEEVIPFEVQPAAIAILRRNAELNNLPNINLSNLGVALGATSGHVQMAGGQDHNLGATAFEPVQKTTSLRMESLDKIIGGKCADFIKIDVEGMEIDVLEGAKQIITRCHPALFIEVRARNLGRFHTLMREHRYRIERTFQMYRGVYNFICFYGW